MWRERVARLLRGLLPFISNEMAVTSPVCELRGSMDCLCQFPSLEGLGVGFPVSRFHSQNHLASLCNIAQALLPFTHEAAHHSIPTRPDGACQQPASQNDPCRGVALESAQTKATLRLRLRSPASAWTTHPGFLLQRVESGGGRGWFRSRPLARTRRAATQGNRSTWRDAPALLELRGEERHGLGAEEN